MTGNRLLAALPDSERSRLSSRLVRVRLTSKQVLYRQEQLIHRVYFPDSGVVSLLPVMGDGELVGVGVVGNEGVVGVHALYPSATMPCEAVVQCPGEAWALSANDLRREIRARGVLADLLGRYSHALLNQAMQVAACNALHSIRQRTARWILEVDQRTDGASFPLTQEVLGNVVGVRRATINAVARDLHRLGLIEYRRGRMRVRNRRRLLAASCECRLVMQAHFARLLPTFPPPSSRRGLAWASDLLSAIA